jgi:uncharacterized protein
VGFYFNRSEENEACADADWLRLNLALWHLTGEAAYLDLAENALVNQLYFTQVDSGAFCYLRGLQSRGGATFDVCCSHDGPRALWEAMRYVFTTDERDVWVNLLLDGATSVSLAEGTLNVASETSYAADTVILALTMGEAPAFRVAVNVRVPAWAGEARVTVNGEPCEVTADSSYLRVERAWMAGDRVAVEYPRRVEVRRGQCLGRHVLNRNEVAVTYGPHVYCVSDRWNPTISLHLVRVDWLGALHTNDFVAVASNRLVSV